MTLSMRAALAMTVALTLAGVGTSSTTPSSVRAVGGEDARSTELQVLLVSTQHWIGENDLILQLLDGNSHAIDDPDGSVLVTLTDPDGIARPPVTPSRGRWAVTGRDLYLARVPLDMVGPWTVSVAVDGAQGTLEGRSSLTVSPDDGTPALGSAVPVVDTPTLADVMNLADAISSDPEQVAAFYWHSVTDVLANGQPFVLVLDSYAFRPNEACGGALGILHDIFIEYPGLTVIHAEPWRMRFASGQLTLEPPGGPAELAPWSVAFGVTQPPWVFVVDGDGRLRAKLTGIFGTDELRAAMGAVSTWRPLGAPATPAPAAVA